jgi:hypothetical protein
MYTWYDSLDRGSARPKATIYTGQETDTTQTYKPTSSMPRVRESISCLRTSNSIRSGKDVRRFKVGTSLGYRQVSLPHPVNTYIYIFFFFPPPTQFVLYLNTLSVTWNKGVDYWMISEWNLERLLTETIIFHYLRHYLPCAWRNWRKPLKPHCLNCHCSSQDSNGTLPEYMGV